MSQDGVLKHFGRVQLELDPVVDPELAVCFGADSQLRRLALGLDLVSVLQSLLVLAQELLEIDLGTHLLPRPFALQL